MPPKITIVNPRDLDAFESIESVVILHIEFRAPAALRCGGFLFLYRPLQSITADVQCATACFWGIGDNSTAILPATAFFGAKVAPHGYSQGQAE